MALQGSLSVQFDFPFFTKVRKEVWPSVGVFCSVFNITDAWFYKDIIAIYILLAVVVMILH